MSEFNISRQVPEIPEFTIERDEDQLPQVVQEPNMSPRKRWMHRIFKVIAAGVLLVLALLGYRFWAYYYRLGVPVSVSPTENIEKLQQPAAAESPEVVMTSDSILGVALDFFAIHGLRANIEMAEPDTADTSVYLYCRSADHKADGTYLGSLVINGDEKQSDQSRLGYMAMLGRRSVIGISRSEKVKDFVQSNDGSFFRQFILVSDGVIPHQFRLHGKVERRAIGRLKEPSGKGDDSTIDRLYYIATRHPETLWDFADALREYGFSDAIYITGGDDYSFYRTHDGMRHDIGSIEDYPHKKWKGLIPWLVFRK